jgi:hypothetical protein
MLVKLLTVNGIEMFSAGLAVTVFSDTVCAKEKVAQIQSK